VLIPEENQKDLSEIPKNIKAGLQIKAVKWIDEVLAIALRSLPVPLLDPAIPATLQAPPEDHDSTRAH